MIIMTLGAFSTLFVNASLINLLPKALMGGLVFYSSINMLLAWLINIRKKISFGDYLLLLIIFAVIAFLRVCSRCVFSVCYRRLYFYCQL